MHHALWEYHSLVQRQRVVDLDERAHLGVRFPTGDGARAPWNAIEDEAGLQAALDDGQELVCTRVRVRGVEAARIEEADCHGAFGADEGREGIDGGEVDGAAGAGLVHEGEGDIGRIGRIGEEDGEAVGFGGGELEGREEGGDTVCAGDGRGGRRRG